MFGFNDVKKFMDAIKTLRFYSMGVCLQTILKVVLKISDLQIMMKDK